VPVLPEFRLFAVSNGNGIQDRITRMNSNSFTQTVSGLASSLFLAIGLTRVAEKFDPLQKQAGSSITHVQSAECSAPCILPCNFFTPRVTK
jgi:hypothetical protein